LRDPTLERLALRLRRESLAQVAEDGHATPGLAVIKRPDGELHRKAPAVGAPPRGAPGELPRAVRLGSRQFVVPAGAVELHQLVEAPTDDRARGNAEEVRRGRIRKV